MSQPPEEKPRDETLVQP